MDANIHDLNARFSITDLKGISQKPICGNESHRGNYEFQFTVMVVLQFQFMILLTRGSWNIICKTNSLVLQINREICLSANNFMKSPL